MHAPGNWKSLLRYVNSVGEACASVVNKWSNRTEELSSLSLPVYPLHKYHSCLYSRRTSHYDFLIRYLKPCILSRWSFPFNSDLNHVGQVLTGHLQRHTHCGLGEYGRPYCPSSSDWVRGVSYSFTLHHNHIPSGRVNTCIFRWIWSQFICQEI